MQIDPVAEWQRLSENYRQMSNPELIELRMQRDQLTEIAQQALDAEFQNRKLTLTPPAARSAVFRSAVDPDRINTFETQKDSSEEDSLVDDDARDFTWKVDLCECADSNEASQLSQALTEAGIDNWIRRPASDGVYGSAFSLSGPRIQVAADQLEEAIAVAKRPIPKEIAEASQSETPDFETPRCPGCGAEDPTLENAEPVNQWFCESCGRQWSDPAEEASAVDPER
jgi:hypothetical protein